FLPARPREGHPATLASRGPRCGDPELGGFPALARLRASFDALCAEMSGGVEAALKALALHRVCGRCIVLGFQGSRSDRCTTSSFAAAPLSMVPAAQRLPATWQSRVSVSPPSEARTGPLGAGCTPRGCW